jgi:hypothetical protein
MSAFKKLKSTDAFVTTYVAKKNWNISGSVLGTYNIQALSALSSSGDIYLNSSKTYGPSNSNISNQGTYYRELVYKSINQLYYSNYNSTNGSILEPKLYNQSTGSNSVVLSDFSSSKFFDNYEQSSLTKIQGVDISGSRYLRQTAHVYSLPREIIGTHIEPTSFKLNADQTGTTYLGARLPIIDNGEGDLVLSSSNYDTNVGNIFYSHGIAVLTNEEAARHFSSSKADSIVFKSNQPIYTYNYHCKVSDYEYNHTLNPSALSGSDNKLKDNVSGSNFNPYITSIGLYNDAQELIAVGKLSQPLLKPSNTELSIQVKLDI